MGNPRKINAILLNIKINRPKLVGMCRYRLASYWQNFTEIYLTWMKILQKSFRGATFLTHTVDLQSKSSDYEKLQPLSICVHGINNITSCMFWTLCIIIHIVRRRSRRTFSTHFEIFSTTFRRRRNLFIFDYDFKLFDDASEFSVTSVVFSLQSSCHIFFKSGFCRD